MDRKERVLSFIQSKEYVPLKLKELMVVLDVPEEDREELEAVLDSLVCEGRIFISKRGKYVASDAESPAVSGVLKCLARGYSGFVVTADEDHKDVFVKHEKMGLALNGDRVLVRIENQGGDRGCPEGRVERILERANKSIVGILEEKRGDYYRVKPDDAKIFKKIRVKPDERGKAQPGDRVNVDIIRYDEQKGKIYGRISAVFGKANSLKSCVEALIVSNDIKSEFDPQTIKMSEAFPQELSGADREGRCDLRDRIIFTIDGDDARDFDDAVSLETNEKGNRVLGVHIADVTHYVKEKTALDDEAFERGTSVYLPDRVIPMLPEALSNGLCSLKPKEDRLALSVFMELDAEGNVLSNRLEKSVIRSCERLTYQNVNAVLEDGDGELTKKYEYIIPVLKEMEKTAAVLRARRFKRGAINFDFPESKIRTDEKGRPVSIEKEIRGTSEKMIEEFMLIANETIAEYAFWSEIPFVYRVHEPPSTDKIMTFQAFILNFGLTLKGKIDRDNPVKPKMLEQIMMQVKDKPEERIVAKTMLRSLMKADYRPVNQGHFGLAAKYYCHFTSPIRRYPDLAIHRILKDFIDGKLTQAKIARYKDFTVRASKRSSDKEVSAELCERDTDDLMKAYYMMKFIGAEFPGVVSGITGFGMFVELENSVEGLVRLENMTDDYYVYDDAVMKIHGERTGKEYKIGDCVHVMVVKTDLLARRIDFILSEDVSKKLLKKFREEEPLEKEKKKGHHQRKGAPRQYKKHKKA